MPPTLSPFLRPRAGRPFHGGALRAFRRLALVLVPLLVLLALLGGCRKEDGEFDAEGSLFTPLDLGSAPLTHEGTVGVDDSYYRVSVTPGTEYDIAITRLTADADLFVFDFAVEPVSGVRCASVNAGTTSERCPLSSSVPGAVSLTGTFIVHVKHAGTTGTKFTLTIAEQ